ncbi:hypothetical protein Y032_0286g1374 [Ancylostoma ceylanicum]|uniref:Uncharacterized protein n=1 Tax=Ancylostoma ceylanicum TaxID=53326 RepID=A0A016S5U7_9BILA|nr:hypothetical protein Y032_0286g1374 [Ancylostoma ceylanicum]
MDPSSSVNQRNFSSIARSLLLSQDSSSNLQLPTTSRGDVYHNVCGVKVEDDNYAVSHRRRKTAYFDVQERILTRAGRSRLVLFEAADGSPPLTPTSNEPDFISRTLLEIHQQNERAKHTCDLCARTRELTTDMLTAPLERPGRVRRPSLGRKAKVTVTRVRQFFDLLKLQMGESCQGTLFNSPAVLTSLACGVSRVTVTRTSMELSRLSYCNGKGMTTLKKYDQEWGVVVRNFVNTVLEEEGMVAVKDLHSRLRFAYADFPMCLTTLRVKVHVEQIFNVILGSNRLSNTSAELRLPERCSLVKNYPARRHINRLCVHERFDTIMSRDVATTSSAKDFSSIARRLLLNKEIQSNLKKKICDCDLCTRIRGLTEERLTAPLEKPYKPVQNKNAPCGRPHFGAEGRLVIRNVRNFFEELKNWLSCSGPALRSTILNMPVAMTSLACGVSLKTVTNHVHNRESRKEEQKRLRQSILMKSYIAEWGVVVRHFVNNELKQGQDVTVSDLYSKICYAYADFPMPESKFLKFLRIIGFSTRKDGEDINVVLKSEPKSEALYEPKSEVPKSEGELCEPERENVENL